MHSYLNIKMSIETQLKISVQTMIWETVIGCWSPGNCPVSQCLCLQSGQWKVRGHTRAFSAVGPGPLTTATGVLCSHALCRVPQGAGLVCGSECVACRGAKQTIWYSPLHTTASSCFLPTLLHGNPLPNVSVNRPCW